MFLIRPVLIAVCVAASCAGCRIPGYEGPVSQSLATCRQFSRRGALALERGQPAEAEGYLAKAVSACPVDCEARRHYAEALWQRGNRAEAIKQLQEAIRLVDDDPALQVRLSEMHLAAGDQVAALEHAQKAIELNPRLASAWATRGRVLRTAGHARQALADLHRCLSYAPEDRKVLFDVAQLHRQLGQHDRALQVLQALAETFPPGEEPQPVLHLMGSTYVALGRFDDAADTFVAAVGNRPNAELCYALADAYWRCGRQAEATTAARQALSIDPNHVPSRELLERASLAGATPPGAVR